MTNSNPGWAAAYTPAASEWATAFSNKVDAAGGSLDSGIFSGTFTGTYTYSGSATFSGATNPIVVSRSASIGGTSNNRSIGSFANYFGTYTGSNQVLAAHAFNISTDSMTTGSAGGFYNGYFGWSYGGSTVTGNRTGLYSVINQTATTGNTGPGNAYYVAAGGVVNAGFNDNGISGTPLGNIFGYNYLVHLSTGATFYKGAIGGENDVQVDTGASVAYKQGFKVILYGNDAVQGSASDYAVGIGRIATTTSVGWLYGLNMCSEDGWWPIDGTNGTLIGSGNPLIGGGPAKSAKYGVKFDDVTFGTSSIQVPGFTVDGSGNATAHSLLAASTVALSGGSNALVQAGDTVTANSNPFCYGYAVGSTLGTLATFGLNAYINPGLTPTRVNTAKNAWYFQLDNRNAVTDGPLLLRVVSSAGSVVTAITFDTGSGLTAGAAVGGTSLRTGGGSGPTWTSGAGAPATTTPVGSLYSNTSGTTGTRLYVSSGGGTWLPVAGV